MDSFTIQIPNDPGERIDCAYHCPNNIKKYNALNKYQGSKGLLIAINKVADVKYGKRLPKGTIHSQTERDIVPFVRASNVKENKVYLTKCATITPEVYEQLYDHYARKGDIIVTIVGTIGEAGLIEDEVTECGFSDNLARLRAISPNVSNEYITIFLNSELGKIQTERHSVGSLQFKLSLKNLRNVIKVLIPFSEKNQDFDLKAQKKILDGYSLYEKKAIKKYKEYEKKIGDYNNFFLKLFDIPIDYKRSEHETYTYDLNMKFFHRIDALYNNPKRDILIKSIKEKSNTTLKRVLKIQNKGSVLPSAFYQLVELDDISSELGEVVNIKDVSKLQSEKVVFRKGEILISKLQPEKGKIILVQDNQEGLVGSSELLPVKRIYEDVTDRYLFHILRSPYVLKQWEYSITGCSRERIGKKELYETIIPLTSEKNQIKVANELDTLLSEAKLRLLDYYTFKEQAKKVFVDKLLETLTPS